MSAPFQKDARPELYHQPASWWPLESAPAEEEKMAVSIREVLTLGRNDFDLSFAGQG